MYVSLFFSFPPLLYTTTCLGEDEYYNREAVRQLNANDEFDEPVEGESLYAACVCVLCVSMFFVVLLCSLLQCMVA